MSEAEFDRFAASYEEEHRRSIAFSGCDTGYFARYKVEIAARHFRMSCAAGETLLDFGCGPGTSIPHFRAALPQARILAADVSRASLAEARARHGAAAEYLPVDAHALDIAPGSVGMAFSACVFHHIPEADQVHWLTELRRAVKPGGALVIFEHNPWNPLTRHAVASCAFDADAILIPARRLSSRLRAAGWRVQRIRYHVFFPEALAGLRRFEPALGLLPLGGQYSAVSLSA